MSQALLTGLVRTAEPQVMLRRFLALDAVVTAANGLVYALAAGPVGRLLGVGEGLLLGLGLFLVAYAAGVGALARQRRPSPFWVSLVVEANAAWALLSVLATVLWFDVTLAGAVWIPAQGLVVAGFAVAQRACLRAGRASQ
ncbi:hypothetical protein ABT160_43345 [Streptomyces sp. NPDC001941]|uniref:hypothetical protein n=1 Tax=Streptomyces sp. NPDC001941 TaxID=3154659 RepID=UPI00331ECFF9